MRHVHDFEKTKRTANFTVIRCTTCKTTRIISKATYLRRMK